MSCTTITTTTTAANDVHDNSAEKVCDISPNTARRVRTDLKTSQNVYLNKTYGPTTRSRTSSPIAIKGRQHTAVADQQHQRKHSPYHSRQQQQQQMSHENLYHHPPSFGSPKNSHYKYKSNATTSANVVTLSSPSSRNIRSSMACSSAAYNAATATTTTNVPTTVASTRKYLRRSNFILTAAKHVVDDSRILSTSAPHEGSSYLSAHLPARATRLLNRSRMQQHCTLNNDNDSDSTRSPLSTRRHHNTATSSRNSTASSVTNNYNNTGNNSSGNNTANSSLQRRHQQHHHQNHQPTSSSSAAYHQHQRDTHSSSDDLMLYDKSFRNAMIQDVLQFKKQLLRLRKILQETETLNPFENDNGQLFTSCGLDSKLLDDIDLASLTSSTTDDPVQELSDLRRQVVYLQGQVDDRDRTIRMQKNLIEQLEAEKHKTTNPTSVENAKECVTTATQTERTRPLSIGMEGLSRLQQFGEQKK
ncbi:putative mediator of RNA polymerase II transcription subunit 24 [Musca vetustissima]|uniref:putative mediator of RNA polymerase II transcription subunit 24 n=1 Tax=Musca vetustissima TaxID=27455 RepID=UPI002AB6B1CF|nr:putative mediator of RNA polymerase II transcription subunit 24 [Musca vetustissima]